MEPPFHSRLSTASDGCTYIIMRVRVDLHALTSVIVQCTMYIHIYTFSRALRIRESHIRAHARAPVRHIKRSAVFYLECARYDLKRPKIQQFSGGGACPQTPPRGMDCPPPPFINPGSATVRIHTCQLKTA